SLPRGLGQRRTDLPCREIGSEPGARRSLNEHEFHTEERPSPMTMTGLFAKRHGALFAGLLSVSLVLTAAAAASAQETRTVEADNGTIEVPAAPQRVAAIGNASLPFIDLGGVPVGVTTMRASALDL